MLPKIKRCPSCYGVNIILINGVVYQNNFKSLQDCKLKKLFHCRKCKAELGLFLNNSNQQDTLIWIEYFKYEDNHYDQLIKLEKDKIKYLKLKSNKKYNSVLSEIRDIQNQIRLDQIKLKVKFKIEKQSMLNKHVY